MTNYTNKYNNITLQQIYDCNNVYNLCNNIYTCTNLNGNSIEEKIFNFNSDLNYLEDFIYFSMQNAKSKLEFQTLEIIFTFFRAFVGNNQHNYTL